MRANAHSAVRILVGPRGVRSPKQVFVAKILRIFSAPFPISECQQVLEPKWLRTTTTTTTINNNNSRSITKPDTALVIVIVVSVVIVIIVKWH